MGKKENVIPFLNSIVQGYLTIDSLTRGDLPTTITSILSMMNSIKNMFNKRILQYEVSIAKELEILAEKQPGLISSISNNEQFASAFTHGLQIAVKNHKLEKLNQLKFGVINAGLCKKEKEDLYSSFLNYIDSLTPTHVKTLTDFMPLGTYGSSYVSDPNPLALETKYKDYLDDLVGRGLMRPPNPITEDDLMRSKYHLITEKGIKFIHFINSTMPVELLEKENK